MPRELETTHATNCEISEKLSDTCTCGVGIQETPFPDLDMDWANEDPGECARCGHPFEWVRPGKSQPTCDCWEV